MPAGAKPKRCRAHYFGLVVLVCCGLGTSAAALTGVSPAVSGTVSFDRNNTFGWRFTPTMDIDVTALGYFDASSLPAGTGAGLVQSHPVGIYRVSDQWLLVSNTVPAGTVGPLQAGYRYAVLETPVRLAAGATYMIAGFGLSATPDPAAAAGSWTMPPEITYANSPTPTVTSPTFGTSQYLVSAHGNSPAGLTFPALAQTGILPAFAANFQFTLVLPQLTSLTLQSNSVVLGISNLTAGLTNCVEQSTELGGWQTVASFVASQTNTNLEVYPAAAPAAFFRIRVGH